MSAPVVARSLPSRRRIHLFLVSATIAGGLCLAGGSSTGATTVVDDRPAAAGVDEERIEFEAGTDNAVRDGNVDVGLTDRWILNATAGQVLDLTVDSADDNTVFTVFAPDRTVLTTVSADSFWSGTLPANGDYSVEVASLGGPAYYMLKVWIDAGYKDPLGLVQRITFAPGTDSGTAGSSVVRASTDIWLVQGRGRSNHASHGELARGQQHVQRVRA